MGWVQGSTAAHLEQDADAEPGALLIGAPRRDREQMHERLHLQLQRLLLLTLLRVGRVRAAQTLPPQIHDLPVGVALRRVRLGAPPCELVWEVRLDGAAQGEVWPRQLIREHGAAARGAVILSTEGREARLAVLREAAAEALLAHGVAAG